MKKQPSVDIMILNYNGIEDTRDCLRSLQKTKYKNFRVYIGDNGSKINESELLKREFNDKRLSFFRFNKNHGFAGGNNRLIAKSKSKYVVLLNNDTTVDAGWLSEPINLLEKDHKIAACQPKILSYQNKNFFDYAGAAGGYLDKLGYPYARGRVGFHLEEDVGQYDDEAEIFWGSGTCFIIRRSIFNKAGGLPEDFFFYHEETDLCWRLKNSGYKIIYTPKSWIYHKGASSSKKQMDKRIFYVHRNNLLLLIRNLSLEKLTFVLPIRIILDLLSVIFYALTGPVNYSFSVLKAYISFINLIPKEIRYLLGRRKEKCKAEGDMKPFSVYFEYFIRGKHRFSEILGSGGKASKLIYYGNMISLTRVKKSKKTLNQLSSWLKKDKVLPVVFVILLGLIMRIPSLSLPLDRDEGAYGYLGWGWLTDRFIIYKDHFDHKPPLTYVIYGLVSIFGGNSAINIRTFSIIYFIFTLLILYFLLRRFSGGFAAFILSIVVLTLISTTNIEGWGFNTEALFIPWVLLATGLINIALKRQNNLYFFAGGLLFGIAGMIKQIAYLPGILIGLYLVMLWITKKGYNLKNIILFLSGAFIPLGIFLLYFYQHDALQDFYLANWVANRKYISYGYELDNIKRFANATGAIFGYIKLLFTTRAVEVTASLVLFVISFIGYLQKKKYTDLFLYSALTLGLFLGVKLAGGRHVGHYYLPLVWGAVFGSAGIFYLDLKINRKLILLFLVLAFTYKLITASTTNGLEISRKQFGETQMQWFADSDDVGKYLANNMSKEQNVYMWGNEAQIYFFSKQVSPIYFMQFYIQDSYPNGWQIWESDLNMAKIDYIVTYKQPEVVPLPQELDRYLESYKTSEIDIGTSFRLIKIEK